jgi:hypothetical protein
LIILHSIPLCLVVSQDLDLIFWDRRESNQYAVKKYFFVTDFLASIRKT